jgi:hypothetical protein
MQADSEDRFFDSEEPSTQTFSVEPAIQEEEEDYMTLKL